MLSFLLLVENLSTIHCHTKGIRQKHSSGNSLSTNNTTRTELAEQQFMKWVSFVGGLKHSVFKTAKNKLFASYTLHVDKNPSLGDFATIQEAIDSLPSINLVRVVIKVHAGVYA
jgi:pectinesterase